MKINIIFTTGLLTLTYFDSTITIYLVESSAQQYQIYGINELINSVFNLNHSCGEYAKIISSNPPKILILISDNLSRLTPFFESYQDIVYNIGRRPLMVYYSFGFFFCKNRICFIMFPLVLSGLFIKELLQNFIYKIINSKFTFKLFVKNTIQVKDKANYLLSKFLRDIHSNCIAPHMKNIKVFHAKRKPNRFTKAQRVNPVISRLLATRASIGNNMNTSVNRLESAVERILNIINANNLAIYENSDGSLGITTPPNISPFLLQELSVNLVSLETSVRVNLDNVMQDFGRVVGIEAELRNLGVAVQPNDFSNRLSRARVAHGRLLAIMVQGEY